MKIRQVLDALEQFAPLPLQEDFDNAGLQVGLTEIEYVQKWIVNLFWKTYEDIHDSKIRELIDWQIAI